MNSIEGENLILKTITMKTPISLITASFLEEKPQQKLAKGSNPRIVQNSFFQVVTYSAAVCTMQYSRTDLKMQFYQGNEKNF